MDQSVPRLLHGQEAPAPERRCKLCGSCAAANVPLLLMKASEAVRLGLGTSAAWLCSVHYAELKFTPRIVRNVVTEPSDTRHSPFAKLSRDVVLLCQ